MNRIVLAAVLLLLSGCWTGTAWFSPSEAVIALPDGGYRLVETAAAQGGGDVVQITREADGTLRIDGPESPLRAVVVPLNHGVADRRYVVQVQGPMLSGEAALFVLLKRQGNRYLVAIPSCGGAVAQAVAAAGGSVSRDPQSASECRFADRATLLHWLRLEASAEGAYKHELRRTTGDQSGKG